MTTPGLSLRGVCKAYPGFELGPVSLDLQPGTAMGLLGPNGAGKTTLLNVIALQSRVTSGAMTYGGANVAWGDARWKSRISYIREAPAFYDELTVGETLRFAARIYEEWDGPFAEALVTRFGLEGSRKVGTLSKGTRVKLGLVAGLAHRAQFLLLDEPTAGLDPDAREDLQRALRDLLRERPDVSILLSSHIFEDLDTVADRVTIIRRGRLVFGCAREELAALALYRLPAGLDPGGLSDARLSWQSDGHRSVLVERGSPLGAALARLPGAVEQPSEAILAAVYRGTQHA